MMRRANTGGTMKPKKQTSLGKGQRLLSGYFNKGLKQSTWNEPNIGKKGAPSLTLEVVDLSDDDFVPPTQCERSCKPTLAKCTSIGRSSVKSPIKHLDAETVVERTLPKPLRLRSSPVKQYPKSASSITGTLPQTKRKLEDEVDSCVSVDIKRPSLARDSKNFTSASVVHSLPVLATIENVPEKKASLQQFWQGGLENLTVEGVCADDDLACAKDIAVDDWGLDDDFDLGHESLDIDINAVPVYRSIKAVVKDVSYTTQGCVRLNVQQTGLQEELQCVLKGSWQNEKVCPGDVIFIHAKFIGRTANIDSEGGFIVTYPDMLVNSTTVVASLLCTRKSVLASKFRDVDGSNVTMLVGSIAHELFQKAVTRNASKDGMLQILNKVLQRSDFLHEMYSLNTTEAEVKELLLKLLPNISHWTEDYMSSKPHANGKQGLLVTAVRDIEDNYWCPRLGIKGKVDATLEVKVHNKRRVLPLELKTGRHTFSSEHKGQVILYTMMMAERQAGDVEEGLLLYIRDCVDMQRVPSRHAERRDLLQRRNELASYLVDATGALPAPIDSQRFCPKCPYATTCSIYRRNSTEGTVSQLERPPEPQFVADSVKHLSAEHTRYFMDWCTMLDMEMKHAKLDLQDRFWVEDAAKREHKGLCFSNVELAKNLEVSYVSDQASFRHTFCRKAHLGRHSMSSSSSLGSFTKCFGLHVGDRVAVSEQESLTCVAVATGSVTSIADDEVVLDLDKNMHSCQEWKTKTFRVDKMFSSASFTISYSNLARLMSAEPESDRLRSLVIDLSVPLYRKTLPKEIAVSCHAVLKPLNQFQRRAILKFLTSDDYILFKGMPGTGKTTTIAALVQTLVLLKKRVLLTSYTHSGVDSVLLKLKARGVPFVRLGATSKVHPDVREFSSSNLTAAITTTRGLQEFYESQCVAKKFGVQGDAHIAIAKLGFTQAARCISDHTCDNISRRDRSARE